MIEVKHLTKRYGNHTAVSDLSFSIEKGQIYGFLGPNGAGKSTTMNIMTGCLAATEGSVTVGGYDIFEQPREAKKLIGYLPEQPPVYPDRTPREYLTFVARAKGIAESDIRKQVAAIMDETGITDVADRLCRNLSKGYRQRVGIAQALLGDPEVVILDEPTVGLDPRQIIEIRELIRRLGETRTVVLSSHILSEVQAVCSTIMIISHGRLVACDTPDNLETLFAGAAAIELTAEAGEGDIRELLDGIENITSIEFTASEPERCTLKLETARESADDLCRALFFAFAKAGRAILRMDTAKASLEDIFLELTGDDSAAEESVSDAAGSDPAAMPEEPAGETAPSEESEAEGE